MWRRTMKSAAESSGEPMTLWTAFVVVICCAILYAGLRGGRRRVTATRIGVVLTCSILWAVHCVVVFCTIANVKGYRFFDGGHDPVWGDVKQWDLFFTSLALMLLSSVCCLVVTLSFVLDYAKHWSAASRMDRGRFLTLSSPTAPRLVRARGSSLVAYCRVPVRSRAAIHPTLRVVSAGAAARTPRSVVALQEPIQVGRPPPGSRRFGSNHPGKGLELANSGPGVLYWLVSIWKGVSSCYRLLGRAD
jgi:hypothetical protein